MEGTFSFISDRVFSFPLQRFDFVLSIEIVKYLIIKLD